MEMGLRPFASPTAREAQAQRQIEIAPPALEVFLQLPPCLQQQCGIRILDPVIRAARRP
jgi:hypothetical protein